MSLAQVRNRLAELNFTGMSQILESTIEGAQKGNLNFLEALDQLLEHEWQYRRSKATVARKIRSRIRKGACLEEFDLSIKRGLTKADIRSLSAMDWCNQGKPVILIGPTGVGKSYLARGMGLLACEHGKTSYFLTVTDFLENLAIARSTNSYFKFREKLVRTDVLILDDFGMRKFSANEAEDLRDIIEHRSYGKSTLITTQLPLNHWAEVIGDEIILDALIDRLEPPGLILKMDGPSYRSKFKKEVEKVESKT